LFGARRKIEHFSGGEASGKSAERRNMSRIHGIQAWVALPRDFYAEADLAPAARLGLEAGLGERGVYIVTGSVSSSRARIEQAKVDWRGGRFDPVPGDDERMPLPG
jgi:hypothetical protein